MSIFGDKWFLIHTSPSSGVQQPHVAGGSLLTVGTERGQNCRLGQVCIYQVPAGCKVQDNTGVHTNLRSSVHAGVRLERSIGYILKAVFQEFKGSFGWLFPDQAFLLSSSLDGSNGPPNTCFFFFFLVSQRSLKASRPKANLSTSLLEPSTFPSQRAASPPAWSEEGTKEGMEVQTRLKRERSQKFRKKSPVASVFLSEVRGKSLCWD